MDVKTNVHTSCSMLLFLCSACFTDVRSHGSCVSSSLVFLKQLDNLEPGTMDDEHGSEHAAANADFGMPFRLEEYDP